MSFGAFLLLLALAASVGLLIQAVTVANSDRREYFGASRVSAIFTVIASLEIIWFSAGLARELFGLSKPPTGMFWVAMIPPALVIVITKISGEHLTGSIRFWGWANIIPLLVIFLGVFLA